MRFFHYSNFLSRQEQFCCQVFFFFTIWRQNKVKIRRGKIKDERKMRFSCILQLFLFLFFIMCYHSIFVVPKHDMLCLCLCKISLTGSKKLNPDPWIQNYKILLTNLYIVQSRSLKLVLPRKKLLIKYFIILPFAY